MKKILVTACALCVAAFAFAERSPVYISPNNDGIQDVLEVPLRIKEKRYISEWNFTITDESGRIVRTIGNKVALPDRITFKSFFRSLITPKQGVAVPASIVWNGFFDDGSLAPDGIYYYQFTASDDNGNTATTSKLQVIVDNTPPEIRLAALSANDKAFGEGSKVTLRIPQSGSKENLWSARITDVEGKIVRSYTWENSEPLTLEWDGTDETSAMVPDGVYNYEISSTDLAGNTSEKAVITNIIYSAEKPQTEIAIAGSKYFSPNDDGILDTISFNISVPQPISKVNSLSNWAVKILDKDGYKVYRTFSGTESAPKSITFDGKDEGGKLLPEGEYRAEVTAKYQNGYEPPVLLSPVFVLDVTAPSATVIAGAKVFNGSDSLEISQQQIKEEMPWTGEKNWTGRILDSDGSAVRVWNFGAAIPENVFWDGMDSSGKLAADGLYYYELSVTEPAGNSSSARTAGFTLDTSKTELMLSVSPAAFSPNGDGVQDTMTFTPVVKASSGIESYSLKVFDSKGKTVYTQSGTGSMPASLSWNGIAADGVTRCEDGTYSVTIETIANSGTMASTPAQNFLLDTAAPQVKISVPYTLFSPDGISRKQSLPVSVTDASREAKWVAEILSKNGTPVRTYTWQNSKPVDFSWDGTDNNGNKVADGEYAVRIASTDSAGNSVRADIPGIVLDTRPVSAYITSAHEVFSPNAEAPRNVQQLSIKASLQDGIESWSFDIIDATSNAVVRRWTQEDSSNLPANFTWAGDKDDGTVANGVYLAKLRASYAKGNDLEATGSMFVCVADAPRLTVSTAPKYFSPDNDGNDDDLFIRLRGETLASLKSWSFTIYDRNGGAFWKTSGKTSITERIIWDGRGNNGELVQSAEDYPYEFTATDELGMTSTVKGIIQTDVLVVRDGNKLKMQVPSIIFRSDNADFGVAGTKDAAGRNITQGITAEQKTNNERVLGMITTALKKFGDYKVTIVGHANRLTDNPDEETMNNPAAWGPALIPLSQERAMFVKNYLVKNGISESRLTVDGKGGTEPVADPKDKDANWKNRRVEFILEK